MRVKASLCTFPNCLCVRKIPPFCEADVTYPLVSKTEVHIKYPDVNRFEVIDSTGRAYVQYNVKDVTLSLQDNGCTLKVFLKENKR